MERYNKNETLFQRLRRDNAMEPLNKSMLVEVKRTSAI